MRFLKFIWLFSTIIVLVWVFVLFVSPFLFKREEIIVPDVIGLSEEEAAKELEKSSLGYSFFYVDGKSLKVSYTMPIANSKVKTGYVVNLYVEKPLPINYSSFIGLFFDDHLKEIEEYCKKHDLTYEVNYVLDSNYVSGTIINQSKSIEEIIKEKDHLVFTVAFSYDYLEMPNLLGKNVDDILTFFDENGLSLSLLYSFAPFSEDTIISQSVEPGKIIKKGNSFVVELIISKGLPIDLNTIILHDFLLSIEAMNKKYDIIYLASSEKSNKLLSFCCQDDSFVIYVSK